MRYWVDYCKYSRNPIQYFFSQNSAHVGHKKSIKHQRILNLPMQEVVKKEIIKWLDVGVIYPLQTVVGCALLSVLPRRMGLLWSQIKSMSLSDAISDLMENLHELL